MSVHPIGLGRNEQGLDGRRRNQMALLRRFGLRPECRLLEIGCGIGWLAYDLASYLDDTGSYAGFDVSPEAIEWLNTNLAPRLPNFRFDLVDAQNPRYRPKERRPAEEVVFPYADGQFDFVCAFGVFMHIDREGVARYLREIARVLEPRKPALVNFMAIFPEDHHPREGHPREGHPRKGHPRKGQQPNGQPRNGRRVYVPIEPGVYTNRPDREGWSLAYDDTLIRSMIEAAGLVVVAFEKGVWHGDAGASNVAAPGADLYVIASKGS
jgi:SAM-dependent methyltransferase